MKPVVIFAATRWELRAVHRAFPTAHATMLAGHRGVVAQTAGQTYWLVQTGVGPDAAAHAATAVMDGQPIESVFSAGFACALAPARIGDLILGEDVTSVRRNGKWAMQDAAVTCDGALRLQMLSTARQAGLDVTVGRVMSAPVVVVSAEDKQRLSRFNGAVALDMESATLGAVAAARGVPFGIVRTVSDLVDEDLPYDFNLFLKPGGWVTGLQAFLTRPAGLVGLNRLRKQSRIAGDRLTKIFACYTGSTSESSMDIARS